MPVSHTLLPTSPQGDLQQLDLQLRSQLTDLLIAPTPQTLTQWCSDTTRLLLEDAPSSSRFHNRLVLTGTVIHCTCQPLLPAPADAAPLLQQFLEQAQTLPAQETPVMLLLQQTLEEYLSLLGQEPEGQTPVIRSICRYIQHNLTAPLSLHMLAQQFHVDRSVLCRKFKREVGCTLSEYVNRKRVATAQQYFQSGHTNIMEVSQLTGYEDSNYFSRVFKRYTGVSPRMYLQNLTH